MKHLYISEPKQISEHLTREILPDDWTIEVGDINFTGNNRSKVEAVLIRSDTIISSSIRQVFPRLQHVVRMGVGLDNVDIDFCDRSGIGVYNAPGVNAEAVSEYVVAMILQTVRKLHLLDIDDIKSWNRRKFVGSSVAGSRVGIVGFGSIGKRILNLLRGFGTSTFYVYDPYVKPADIPDDVILVDSLDVLLENCNVITLHVPLTDDTKHILNDRNLHLLNEGCILVNASRGGVVSEKAVLEHMKKHELIYVADVVEDEPYVSEDMLNDRNVVITPHVASLTEESETAMLTVALHNFIQRKPVNTPVPFSK